MKEALKVWGPVALIALVAVVIALRVIAPPPPRTITFAAGAADGSYYALAEQYRDALAEHGVKVTVLETAGTGDNYQLLLSGEADVALLQGGLASDEARDVVLTLGGVFSEPFWIIVRRDLAIDDFGDLRTARVAAGIPGSGTRALADDLSTAWGGRWSEFLPLSGEGAVAALKAGDVDAAVFATSVDTPYIQALLKDPALRPLSVRRAQGLSMNYPALAPKTLYEGVISLDPNIPARDISLVAAIAQLGVDKKLHPALQAVLLEAAEDIHRGGNALTRAGAFPNPTDIDLPLSDEAKRYYRNGPTFLRRYFSFGMANFLERAWVFLIPLVAILIPLVQMAPPVYRWRTRRKIYVWYKDLHTLERRGVEASDPEIRQQVLNDINELQMEVGQVNVPVSYNEELYQLRSHINFVEALIARQGLKAAK
ncbi:TAXI family TRAP transporter solute-binding subunit [Hyphomonas sp. FCG-A18]|uniref:TAXI family TRAP transporter solute-binding subunit n=1 Tax=Hyphomonas sp. FCG-A18 TaxID=3080019 RepID=UPI002B27C7A5|nr:TAXI family TRAP transporter solute-binding subunit [Hyphomonas sp. FCG-A18]